MFSSTRIHVKNLNSKIAIVGGLGFIGKSLARHLSKKFEVKILDVKPITKDLKGFVTHVRCDVRNYQETTNGLNDVNIFIHAAIVQIPLINENKSLGYEVNVIGDSKRLQDCRRKFEWKGYDTG